MWVMEEHVLVKEIGVSFTPLEIHNKDFTQTFFRHGYDQDQINEYLDAVIKDYGTFIKYIQQLQRKIADMQKTFDILNDPEPEGLLSLQSLNMRVAALEQQLARNAPLR